MTRPSQKRATSARSGRRSGGTDGTPTDAVGRSATSNSFGTFAHRALAVWRHIASGELNYVQATATFKNSTTLVVEKKDGSKEELTFNKIVVATGSRIATIPSLNIGSKRLLNSTSALDLPAIPKSLLVIGGGYIGLELGSVYQALGSKVSVVEMLDGLLPGADRDLVSHLSKRLKEKFDSIMLNSKVVEMKEVKDEIQVKIQDAEGKTTDQNYDYVLISIGRRPDTSGLGLENTKVKVNERGWIMGGGPC